MALTCIRCAQSGEPAPAHRIGFPAGVKDKIVASVCATCWKEWEGVEVKVINEYRLNFLDPQHRQMLAATAAEFFKLPAE
jgi:Fe-S cluster biosynthesis and repair protein YggX